MTTALLLTQEELMEGYRIFIKLEATGVITLKPSEML